MSTTTEKPPRKFPPPCWTPDEALVLIEAYRERWYALRRGYLRTADWDAVAAAVGHSCPDASPAKTSAQCRHKMEKLRQRYRAEKQRALSFPGRFLSSWFYFESMDAMENGSSTVGSNQETGDQVDSGNGSRVKTVINQNLIPSVFNSKNSKKMDGDSNPNIGFHYNSVPLGIRAKNSGKIDGKSSLSLGYRVSNGYTSYLDYGSDEEAGGGNDLGVEFRVKSPIDWNLVPSGFRANKFGKSRSKSTPKFDSDHGGGDGVDFGGGFYGKTPMDQDSVPGFRAKNFCKIDGKLNPSWDHGGYDGIHGNGEFWVKIPGDRNSVPAGFRGKYSGKTDRNSNPNIDPSVLNGFTSPLRSEFGKKGGGGGVKRERGLVADMVSSIKLLGEGFVKMEKMKMEMAREIETMRMEMEMKRNEMLLESQQQIVDAFVKGLFEKKKLKPTVLPDS